MLQFFHCSQLCLKLVVCPSFTKITHYIYEVPIISSPCSILQRTEIFLNTCTSWWEMEVAIRNGTTKTIIPIIKTKVSYFELLELMNKFESTCVLQCLSWNTESKSTRAENVKILSLHFCQKYLWFQGRKTWWVLPGLPVDFCYVS